MTEKKRKFREGDQVKLRPESPLLRDHKRDAGEVGTVVSVESEPHETGPTYRIAVRFPSQAQDEKPVAAWQSEFVLVETTESEFK
jgi:hypothetical protein